MIVNAVLIDDGFGVARRAFEFDGAGLWIEISAI
jgi:hypothetical protein